MNNSSTCCNTKELGLAAKVVLSTWYGLTGLAAIIGNGIVMWLIVRNRSLRTISNLFLTSLAAADFLVGLVIDPVWISIRCLGYNSDTYVQTYGKFIDYLWIHTTVATTFNLCCVTLDRHIAIFYPLRYENIITNRRCHVLIATVWFMSLALPCSRFLISDVRGLSTLYISFTVITILLPMIIIIFCSIRILKVATVQFKKIITDVNLQNQDAVKKRKKNFKAAKTVSIVVGLFVVCWLPSLITSFTHYFSKKVSYNSVYYTVWTSVEAVAFPSSAINPWVYCLRNEEFYEALKRTFRCSIKRNSEQSCFQLTDKQINRELGKHNTCNSPV
ncbi:adenosine receptor A2a-like [Oculina patagonica]